VALSFSLQVVYVTGVFLFMTIKKQLGMSRPLQVDGRFSNLIIQGSKSLVHLRGNLVVEHLTTNTISSNNIQFKDNPIPNHYLGIADTQGNLKLIPPSDYWLSIDPTTIRSQYQVGIGKDAEFPLDVQGTARSSSLITGNIKLEDGRLQANTFQFFTTPLTPSLTLSTSGLELPGDITFSGSLHRHGFLDGVPIRSSFSLPDSPLSQDTLLSTDATQFIRNKTLVQASLLGDTSFVSPARLRNVDMPIDGADVATKQYVDERLQGLEYQDSVLEFASSPPLFFVSVGDRFIVRQASGDWLGRENHIAQYTSSGWIFTTPTAGMACYVENEQLQYSFSVSEQKWVKLGSTLRHAHLAELMQDDHLQYALLVGRSGGQVLAGGPQTEDSLVLKHSSALVANQANAGRVLLQPDGGAVQIGSTVSNFYIPPLVPQCSIYGPVVNLVTHTQSSIQQDWVTATHVHRWSFDADRFTWSTFGTNGLTADRIRVNTGSIGFTGPVLVDSGKGARDPQAEDHDADAGLVLGPNRALITDLLCLDRLTTRTQSFLLVTPLLHAASGILFPGSQAQGSTEGFTARGSNALDSSPYWELASTNGSRLQVCDSGARLGRITDPSVPITSALEVHGSWITMDAVSDSDPSWTGIRMNNSLHPGHVNVLYQHRATRNTFLAGTRISLTDTRSPFPVFQCDTEQRTVGINMNPSTTWSVLGQTDTHYAPDTRVVVDQAAASLVILDNVILRPGESLRIGDQLLLDNQWNTIVSIDSLTPLRLIMASMMLAASYANIAKRSPASRWLTDTSQAHVTLLPDQGVHVGNLRYAQQALLGVDVPLGTPHTTPVAASFAHGSTFVRLADNMGHGLLVHSAPSSSTSYALLVQNPSGPLLSVLQSQVGVGTSSPAQKFHVNTAIRGEGARIGNCDLIISPDSDQVFQLVHKDAPTPAVTQSSSGSTVLASAPLASLSINQGAASKFFIAPSGRVGLGTTTPQQDIHLVAPKIQIDGDVRVNGTLTFDFSSDLQFNGSLIRLATQNSGDLVDIGFVGRYRSAPDVYRYTGLARNSLDANRSFVLFEDAAGVQTNTVFDSTWQWAPLQTRGIELLDRTKTFTFTQRLGTQSIEHLSSFNSVVKQTYSVNPQGDTSFKMTNQISPALFLSGTNYVGINTAAPTDTLDVNGSITCVGMNIVSDARVKTNIAPWDLNESQRIITQLEMVSYSYTKDFASQSQQRNASQVGIIAQQAQQVSASLVSQRAQQIGDQTVHDFCVLDQTRLLMHALAAIQSLQQQVQTLQQQVQLLQSKLAHFLVL
jgi:hypothetical protein